MKLTYLGHDAFKISNGKVIYIDPYKLDNPEKADIVLLTHPHFDHTSAEDLKKIKKDNTVFITTTDSEIIHGIRAMNPGEEEIVDGIKVNAIAAYNIDKFKEPGVPFHPKENSWNGYILTIGNTRVYHAGDTDNIPEMKDVKCDIALLPVSGIYVMTAEEAAEAALKIRPKLAIPMHYGSVAGSITDAEIFKEKCEKKGIKSKILRNGESIEL